MNCLKRQAWEQEDASPSVNSPRHLLRQALQAKRAGECAWAEMNTRDKLSVALVLNRPDWLSRLDYTIANALVRAGDEWVSAIPRISHLIEHGDDVHMP